MSDGYPIIFVHGINLNQKVYNGTICDGNLRKDSLLDFKEMQKKLEDDGLYVNAGEIGNEFTSCPSNWQNNKPISVRMSYYTNCIEDTVYWGDYANRLGKVIDEVRSCTKSQKVNIISHSLGGIVTRYYIKYVPNHASDEINKVIMLGTPNHGISPALTGLSLNTCWYKNDNDSFLFCPLGQVDMFPNNPKGVLNDLNIQETYPPIRYYTIGTTQWDGLVTINSVSLKGANKNFVVDTGCDHSGLRVPDRCKQAYNFVLEALKSSTTSTETKTQQQLNQQPNTLQSQPGITQQSQTQQNTRTDKPNPQSKPTNEKPKETQSEPQKQEQKREEPKTVASSIKSWFSKWFG